MWGLEDVRNPSSTTRTEIGAVPEGTRTYFVWVCRSGPKHCRVVCTVVGEVCLERRRRGTPSRARTEGEVVSREGLDVRSVDFVIGSARSGPKGPPTVPGEGRWAGKRVK